jgi:hypothetical protein
MTIDSSTYIEDFDVLHVHSPFSWRKPWRYLSAIIRFMEKLRYGPEASHFSHTAIALWHANELYIYEADPQVKKTLFADWVKDKEIAIGRVPFKLYNKHGSSKEEIRTILKSKLGVRYDYFSLVVFQILLILSGKWYGSKNSNTFYCSEYTSWILYVGTGLPENWYSVSPARSYNGFKEEGWICYRGKASDLLAQ